MEEIKARVYLPNVSAEFAELVHQGAYLPNFGELADGVYTREFAEKIPTLLRVVVEARPQEIPPALLVLPPDAEVVLRETGSDTVVKAWLAITTLESTMQRQAKGFFTLSEAAEILSSSMRDQWGERMPAATMNKKMKLAFCNGALTFYDEYHEPIDLDNLKNMKEPGYDLHMLYTEGDKLGWYGETTSPKAINAWLKSTGSPYRFPEPTTPPAPPVVPEPQATTPSPPPVVAESASETKEQRQDRRLKACIDAGLPMDTKAALLRLPDGVGKVAALENRTRQAFTDDVKAALKRWESAKKEGPTKLPEPERKELIERAVGREP